jgi:protein-disulfide isomerase
MIDQTETGIPQSTNGGAQAYAIPVAIVIAGGLIGVAVFFSGGNASAPTTAGSNQPIGQVAEPTGTLEDVRPVTAEDHVKGNPNAKVFIVEYSDYECPFCKRFHETMNEVMDIYGENGDVAWVYRHFPLDQLHPKNARVVAVTSECVNEHGGNDMFWRFTDRFFELTPANDRTDLTEVLPQIYGEIGADQVAVESCVASGKYDEHIEADISNAIATGGRGTPWSVIVGQNGTIFPLNGAQPLGAVEQLVELAKKGQ